MKIEKAIEVLQNEVNHGFRCGYEDLTTAQKLGIEALKLYKEIDSALGEFSDSEDYDLVSNYWKNRLFSYRERLRNKKG